MPDDLSTFRQQIANQGLTKPDAYTPYAAGMKLYGGGRSNPTMGPVQKEGYEERDRLNRTKRQAVLNQMKKAQSGEFMSPEVLNSQGGL